jgi:hypothetical protein
MSLFVLSLYIPRELFCISNWGTARARRTLRERFNEVYQPAPSRQLLVLRGLLVTMAKTKLQG